MSKRMTNEEARDCILQAANQRFQVYGLVKTTMAEIAGDCGMSPANLYRHFENKMDIVGQLAMQCSAVEQDLLRMVIADEASSAAQKLESFVLASLRFHYTEWQERPKLSELVEAVCSERKDIVGRKIAIKNALLVTLLEQGTESGEFEVKGEFPVVAESIIAATVLFCTPTFMPLFPREEFENKARNVVQLILQGLWRE